MRRRRLPLGSFGLPRPVGGQRPLTQPELERLQQLHDALLACRYTGPKLTRHRARVALADELDRLNSDGVPFSHLGAALGISKQRAHDIATFDIDTKE